jgi:hypothetical protein
MKAQNRTRYWNIGGFLFLLAGLLWIIAGNTALGASNIAIGIAFIAIGRVTAGKAGEQDDSSPENSSVK